MPLDGLRAWIGEVERKLGMRTRVFLVLTALAIGGTGAAIYLALDTRDKAVSEGDVRTLQQNLEAQIAGGGSATGTDLTQLETDLRALEAKVETLRGGGESSGGGAGAGTDDTAPPNTGDALPDAAGEANDDGIATNEPPPKGRLQDFLDQAKE